MLKRDWKVKEESVCSSAEISNRSIRLAERNREGITDDIYERKVNAHKIRRWISVLLSRILLGREVENEFGEKLAWERWVFCLGGKFKLYYYWKESFLNYSNYDFMSTIIITKIIWDYISNKNILKALSVLYINLIAVYINSGFEEKTVKVVRRSQFLPCTTLVRPF